MPLIDVTLNPGYRMRLAGMQDRVSAAEDITRELVKGSFAQALPGLLTANARALMLDPNTPPEGVQVQNHDYGEFDVNVANIWVKIQFSEGRPDEAAHIQVRDALYDILVGWFVDQGLIPENIVMDLFWGPTNGKGSVSGVEIVW